MLKVECYKSPKLNERPVAFSLSNSRYKIEEIILSEEIQKISATKIRAKMREDGDLK